MTEASTRTNTPSPRHPGRIPAWWIAAAAFLYPPVLDAGKARFEWRSSPDSLALLDERGSVVWQFNHPDPPTKPHFHPVGLPGHPPLTWVAPPDHIWHLGLWFSWKFINGRNHWETDPSGRSEGLSRLVSFAPETRTDGSARLTMELAYSADRDAQVELREHRVIAISAPAEDGRYHMDWEMEFTAGDAPVVLDRTPLPHEPGGKPWGGYAGLTWRFAQGFVEWSVVNSANDRGMETHGVAAKGCDFSGELAGAPQGVAILDHPESLRAPTPWYVAMEQETPFACVIASPLFRSALALPAGKSFRLRHRVVLHPGRWASADLEKACTEYVRETFTTGPSHPPKTAAR